MHSLISHSYEQLGSVELTSSCLEKLNVVAKLQKPTQKLLDIRRKYLETYSLEDLYDPIGMPPDLKSAHNELDKHVDQLYRKKPFESEQERKEFLLSKYSEMIKKHILDQ